MPEKEFQAKVLQIIILDLVETLWQDLERSNVRDGHLKRLEEHIKEVTGEPISSRTLRDYLKGSVGDQVQCRDYIAAAWRVAMGMAEKHDIYRSTKQSFNVCVKEFQKRRDFLVGYRGKPEGDMLEYVDDYSKDGKLVQHLSAFANTRGGLIVIGMDDPKKDQPATRLTGKEPLLHKAEAAIRCLTPEEHVSQLKIRHGWVCKWQGFSDEGGCELVYFIEVPFYANRTVIFKANGVKAYIRNGSHSDEMPEGMHTEPGIPCYVTKARAKLLRNHRRIVSLARASLYGGDIETVTIVLLYYIATTFATYLIEALGEIYTLIISDRHLLEFREEKTKQMAEKLRNGRISEFMSEMMKSEQTIYDVLEGERSAISRVFQLARIWERNDGVVDDEFVNAVGLQSEAEITLPIILKLASGLNAISRAVDSAIIQKHELKVQEAEDLPS